MVPSIRFHGTTHMHLIVGQRYHYRGVGDALNRCATLHHLNKINVSQQREQQQINGNCHAISKTVHKPTFCSLYPAFLLGSIKLSSIEEAKVVHAHIIKTQRQPHISFWNNILHEYAKKGTQIDDARQVFDRMPERNSVSWNAMIAGYVQHGYSNKGLRIFSLMRMQEIKPNEFSFSSVLRACASLAALREGKQIHSAITKSGFHLDAFAATALVDMYAKCRQLDDARQVFDEMPERRVVSWNALIAGYAQIGNGDEALELFCRMQLVGMTPTEFTFSSVLMGCAGIIALQEGKQVHSTVIKYGIHSDVFVGSGLLDMYTKCSSIEDGVRVFERMPERNVVSWTMMIAGYAQHYCIKEVLGLVNQMQLAHVRLNQFTANSILSACVIPEALESGKQVHALVIKSGIECDAALVTMYAKCGCVQGAMKVYVKIPEPDVVSRNAMIAAYAQNECSEEALQHFAEMHRAAMMADLFTFASILKACANLAGSEQGRQIHAYAAKVGCNSDMSIQNALVTMYAKSGSIEEARQVFVKMPERNVVSWNAIVAGCAQHGQGNEALKLFQQMQEAGVKPDHITFIGVLSACSHVGLLDLGCMYFDSMARDHGITPRMEHYSCIVDLLGRGGHLGQAEAFIRAMPLKPTGPVWKTLLGACRVYGDMEMGKRAAECLLQVEPEDAASYVLLSNMFAADGRWGDAARMRKLMNDRGVKKEPGCSWIEVNKRVHAFVTEDRAHDLIDVHANLDLSNKTFMSHD